MSYVNEMDELIAVVQEQPNDIRHYGKGHLDGGHSGRYPWGTGEVPMQSSDRRQIDFIDRVDKLKADGWKDTPENIMKEFGMTSSQYRANLSYANDMRRLQKYNRVEALHQHGMSATEIGKELGMNESTVRSLLDKEKYNNMLATKETIEFLKDRLAENPGCFVDVGSGTEVDLGISATKMKNALAIMEQEGYLVYSGGVPQIGQTDQQTITKVLGTPDMEKKDFYAFKNGEANIVGLQDYTSDDAGTSFRKMEYPTSVSSSRVQVLYGDDVRPDGFKGVDLDGVVEIRPGCADLSLGDKHYAQVRIMVDGTHYIKGMAVYNDDLPDGIDLRFNSNKPQGMPILGEDKTNSVLKPIKHDDPDNPFGTTIKANGQSYYTDSDGTKKLSPINIKSEEGDWSDWADTLPSQFLGKQSLKLAQQQLDEAYQQRRDDLDSIKSVTNPTVKKYLLESYADEADSAATHLKAAAIPGQKYRVLLPINNQKDDECYCPAYENGTKLALVRYPHADTSEIPIVTVNNNNTLGEKFIGKNSYDAIGITKATFERMSGADSDGDTAMCLPQSAKYKVISTPQLEGLKGFDPSSAYPAVEGMKVMTKKMTQRQMGEVSNLITDMQAIGAASSSSSDKAKFTSDLEKAMRHSMVVIDAEKHKLNYKQSEIDNDIKRLKDEYQDGGGASTLLSQATSVVHVAKTQGQGYTNIKGKEGYDSSKAEGDKIYKVADDAYYTGRKYNKKTGEWVETGTKVRTKEVSKMSTVDNAEDLISSHSSPMEHVYANYANQCKSLAREARLEAANTGKQAYSPAAKKAYQEEVDSLEEKLRVADSNKPKERQAQYQANVIVSQKVAAAQASGKTLEKKDLSKLGTQALTKARASVGSVSRKDRNIVIEDKEWEAIQAGAVSERTLKRILAVSDTDSLRAKATPNAKRNTISDSKKQQILRMANDDRYTLAEVAERFGISASTINTLINE